MRLAMSPARLVRLTLALSMAALLTHRGFTQTPNEGVPLDFQADSTEFQPGTGAAVLEGNVRIAYDDMLLTADRAELNAQSGQVAAQGNIQFTRGVLMWQGTEITGNFKTKEFRTDAFRGTSGVWYVKGKSASHAADGTVTTERTQLSTCDQVEHPHYSLNAKRVVYFADGKFRAYHTTLKVGRVPVFYWPLVFGDTEADTGEIEIQPGYSGDWGGFVLLGRQWRIGEATRTKLMLDYRSKRGLALGNRTRIQTARSKSEFLVYGMQDHDPPVTSKAKGENPAYNRGFEVEEERRRVKVSHRDTWLHDDLTLRLKVDALSDIDMLEDWFRREHKKNTQPRSFVDATLDADRFSLSLSARPRLNDFFTVVETLPELRLMVHRQPIGTTGLYYQSETSVGDYAIAWREYDQLDHPGVDYDTFRADTTHMLHWPARIADKLQIVPRAGFRLTYYGDSSRTKVGIGDLGALFALDDPDLRRKGTFAVYDDQGGSRTRFAGELGLELKTKFYRVWPDYKLPDWGVDGLRHIVEPYLNYTCISDPTEDRENLYFFDAVDRLIEQNFVRLGLNQRLQTRKARQVYTMANLETYADFHFPTEDDRDGMGNLGARLQIEPPKKPLKAWTTIVYDVGEGNINRGEVGLSLGRPKQAQLSLAYIYRNEYRARSVYSMGSSLVDFSGENSLLARDFSESHTASLKLRFRINDKTAGRVSCSYDLKQDEFSLKRYEVIRDLHCWKGSLAFQEEEDENAIIFYLSLKAHPGVGARFSREHEESDN